MACKALPVGSWGKITVQCSNGSFRAQGRYRDYDGRTRQVEVSGFSHIKPGGRMSENPETRPTRAEYLRGYIKARRQWRRQQLVAMLGGVCVRCGATEDLEFDHIDPATKRFAVGSSMSRAWDELVEEALKCQLLCR